MRIALDKHLSNIISANIIISALIADYVYLSGRGSFQFKRLMLQIALLCIIRHRVSHS